MSNVLKPDDYMIMYVLDMQTNGEVGRILNGNGMPNATVCPECRVDDFTHVASCKLLRDLAKRLKKTLKVKKK